jgi:hypothetical protein
MSLYSIKTCPSIALSQDLISKPKTPWKRYSICAIIDRVFDRIMWLASLYNARVLYCTVACYIASDSSTLCSSLARYPCDLTTRQSDSPHLLIPSFHTFDVFSMSETKGSKPRASVEACQTTGSNEDVAHGAVADITSGSQSLHRSLRGKEVQLFAIGGAIGTCMSP